ncbi:SDR family NAD(P)-dependent oxidoreductase [Paenibacillus harenae]|uniref:SDR family NAD(P)-dependent oxidoreductase n=1 Tax=Paenibacillus harenae TaxID=306543 RepID=UPI002794D689|nr:SDR family oxidoreductase [Paenibacillus harenae]MDQ0060169.1 NAD(P)-dependent dehydrogenase (short-subunit alcohol dehydrogenase family) [Paenibacillus harenae]
MEFTFTGKVVLITGAGGGIGRVVALAYAQQGAIVVITDKLEDKLEETANLLREKGFDSHRYAADMSKPEQIAALVKQIGELLGTIDIVINNAGFGIWKPPYDLELDEWDDVINTNLRGTFVCAREAAKLMRVGGGGSIVNISSTRAMMSEPNSEAYAASKGGILSLTHALAVSLGPDRITVNAICPGWIENGDYSRLRPEDHTQHPSQRVGRPNDIARACLYLTNPQNDFITGTSLTIDGGMTRKMIYEE